MISSTTPRNTPSAASRRGGAREPPAGLRVGAEVRAGRSGDRAERAEYPSPEGNGTVQGLMVRPPGARSASGGAGGPREPRPQPLHRGRGAAARQGRLPRTGAGRAHLARRLSRQRREGPRDAVEVDPAKLLAGLLRGYEYLPTIPFHGKVGAVASARRRRLQPLAVAFPEIVAAVPFYGRQPTPTTCQDQGAAAPHYAGLDERVNAAGRLRGGAEGAARSTRPISIRAPTTASTTTPRRATTRPRRSWPGSERWPREEVSHCRAPEPTRYGKCRGALTRAEALSKILKSGKPNSCT